MTLKLNVGLSKKIGQPDYGSLGASCHIEVELDQMLLFHDLDGLHHRIKQAFVACRQAVQDELYRQQHEGDPPQNGSAQQPAAIGNGHPANGSNNGSSPADNVHKNGIQRRPRKATASQVRAIQAIAERLQLDLAAWLQERYGLRVPSELSISDASSAIDGLKAITPASGGRY